MKTVSTNPAISKSDSVACNLIADYIVADRFIIGDVYLFHKANPRCPAGSSLWGVFDKCKNGEVYLESSSTDNEKFDTWCRLPDGYMYCRLTTRAELSQYVFEQTWYESRKVLGAEKSFRMP